MIVPHFKELPCASIGKLYALADSFGLEANHIRITSVNDVFTC